MKIYEIHNYYHGLSSPCYYINEIENNANAIENICRSRWTHNTCEIKTCQKNVYKKRGKNRA